MLFLIGFVWLVTASFAFVLAMLTPNWIAFTKSTSTANFTIQRGIFYVCDLLSSSDTSQTTLCVPILQQTSSTDSNQWNYQYAIACASLAIACAGLSIITIWFSGFYFQARRRTKSASCSLLTIGLLILLIFCTSFVVWILIISETLQLGVSIDRSMFSWPMWLAVGATGGYLMSLISILLSFCTTCRREKNIEQNYYNPRNQF